MTSLRVVAAGARQHRHPAGRFVDENLDDPDALRVRQWSGISPVVPQGTRKWMPASICRRRAAGLTAGLAGRGIRGRPGVMALDVRIHGRGGQGVVTAAELLSLAAFDQGLHAQALPSFGSERTGAPVVAFCRIDERPIRVARPGRPPGPGGAAGPDPAARR